MNSEMGLLSGLRVGFGFQVRKFAAGERLTLGGSDIAADAGLGGKLHGDIVSHAVIEALLSANGLPSLDVLFPDEKGDLEQGEPLVVLSQTVTGLLRQRMAAVLNLSVQIVARQPDLDSYRKPMMLALAAALQIDPTQVSIAIDRHSDFETVSEGKAAVAFANVLCALNPVGQKAKRKKGTAARTQPAPPAPQAPPAAEDDMQPARVKDFNKAVATKLPPLPQAPAPKPGDVLIVYSDGASRGNPGPSATGWVVLNEQGQLVREGGSSIGNRTNNQAEYEAVKEAASTIESALGRDFKVQFRLDSELVVKQLRGEWKIKDKALKQLALQTLNILMYFSEFDVTHVPREENRRADTLANRVLGKK